VTRATRLARNAGLVSFRLRLGLRPARRVLPKLIPPTLAPSPAAHRRRAVVLALTLAVAGCALAPPRLAAQVDSSVRLKNAAVNGALGAATVVVRRAVGRRLTPAAVAQGAAGGVAMSLGRQMAGSGAPGSGLLGRTVHAGGLSLVAAAVSDDRVLLLPVGPLTLHVPTESGRPLRARIDAADTFVLLQTAFAPGTRLDAGASLSAGAPVFVRPQARMRDPTVRGYARLGTVVLSDAPHSDYARATLLAHETIHVLQLDALRLLAAHPAERAVLGRVPGFGVVGRHIDVGLVAPAVVSALHVSVERHRHPFEREAYLLSIGRIPGDGGGSGGFRPGLVNMR
jgi:hypothetical protein